MFKNYFLIFFISLSAFSQDNTQKKIYSWYDLQTGIENSTLFRGIEYVETDRMINEKHKFFKSKDFKIGAVTYNGQIFYNVPLKYNIYNDLLLVSFYQGQRNFVFSLISNKVNQFQISDHLFRYFKSDNNSDIAGFYEVINEDGEFKIYKKHLQNRKEVRDRSIAYSEFSSVDPDYVFQFQNDFFELGNRRDLFSEFPAFKSKIRGFYNKYKEQSHDKPDIFMKNLANEMNALISVAANETQE
jgi:hypothetical protein